MWTIGDVKSKGKEAFKANYWRCVLVAFILTFVTGASNSAARPNTGTADSELSNSLTSMTPAQQLTVLGVLMAFLGLGAILGILIRIFIKNPLEVGCYTFFKKNVANPTTELGAIKEGFSGFGHIFCTLFLRDLFTLLWGCLFIIPGIVKSYSYRMVPYIIKDNPELSAIEVITRSREMMNGNKWKAFLLDLSFIGWIILTVITLGIAGVFYVFPYIQSTNATLYLELSNKQ